MKLVAHLLVTLLACASAVVAAADLPTAGKARIVITSEPLRGNTADVAINGRHVATIGVDDTYKALYDPGEIVITTRGGRAEFVAEADKEYWLELSLKPSTSGFLMFGLVGASSMGDYPITLRETRDIQK